MELLGQSLQLAVRLHGKVTDLSATDLYLHLWFIQPAMCYRVSCDLDPSEDTSAEEPQSDGPVIVGAERWVHIFRKLLLFCA